MWERFSFYGMRGLLIFYLTQHFMFDDTFANGQYGAYGALVYLVPLLGGFLAVAAWRPRLQAMALAAGYISVFSFLGLAWLIGESNAQMERVVVADQVAAVCLLIALPVFLISRRKA